ncbi:hypothetical protein [Bythopirellula polymerisocia]|uniref:Glutamine amidotransferase domain-containing protein n=1 Tax=Bythopirellula polymerisocia TaxID=2528003 RepID=A0A5C6CTE3_9BACT|nr:hypothetical protein [Bythopirellula polymerisocia]TWU26009.1 hypothetical protein Pla144_32260 [Bythopirellula polymerisocia]
MNSTGHFTLMWTPWSIAFTLLAFMATAVIGVISWRRSGMRPSIATLEFLRLAIVLFAGLLLNQPEWIEEFVPTDKPAIVVLWDDSASMETRDVLDEQDNGTPITRRTAVAPLVSQSAWSQLSERYEVVILPFASPKSGLGTNLYQPIVDAIDQSARLAGVVLASDGDWNEGPPPVDAATRMRMKEIPLMTLTVGSRERLPDVELVSLDAPTFGVAGKSVRIPFTIDSSLPREQLATVILKTGDGDEITKEVRIAANGRTTDAVIWKPNEIGDTTVSLEIPRQPNEVLPDNNQLTAPISIREEKLRVLIIESYPRWEYRYLRNALSRDSGVDVSCLLFHPGLSKPGGGNKDYIKEFPTGLDELAKYDVVFLGDVGCEEGQLTDEQCRLLRGLVEQQASGLVFMPGWQGRQFTLLDTRLKDLYPVVLDDSQPGGWGSRLPNQFELTESGRRSLLTRLADVQQDNAEVWDALPGFQWYAPVLRAKAGSEVLCVHRDASNQYGRLPLLVTQTFGTGKVLFMGTDGAWRWRKGVEDKYHYRFWGQVVRWMAYQRNMAEGETMRLYYSPDQPPLRHTITFNANVMDTSGEPLSQGTVSARISAPSGKSHTVRFTSRSDEWGAFTAQFTTAEPGTHRLVLSCQETGAVFETTFFVQGAAIEPVGRPALPEVMAELARVTGGQSLTKVDPSEIIEYFATLPEPPPAVRRLQIWRHPLTLGTMVCLLGAFWIARKAVGLV